MSARVGTTLAQAKINLALRVLARESDGYHSIETVFLRLELGDDVRVDVRQSQRTLTCAQTPDIPAEKNLGFRAAAAYAERTGWPDGFAIDITKRIPICGGLGGGSADAAAVLRILNTLSPRPLCIEELLSVALTIGSDVPFLTSSYIMALAWGRGERMTELKPLPANDVQLIIPAFGVSTAHAYAELDRIRGSEPARPPEFTVEMFKSWNDAARNSVNDFEEVVSAEFEAGGLMPLLTQSKKSGGGSLVRMTGSGSTIFVVQNTAALNRDRANPPRASSNTPALQLARVSLETKIITTRTATSVVPVTVLD